MRQKNSTQNRDITLKHKIFRYPKLVRHWRVPLRSFSVLWDKKFSIENRDIPLLGIKFFDTRNFLKHRRVPRRNFSALWDENFSRKIVIPAPSLIPNILRYQKHSEIQKGYSTNFFGTVWKKFSTEKRDTPLSHAKNFSVPEIFWYTEVFPNEIFRYCETKNFERKVVIPPLLHKVQKSVVELMLVKPL